MSTNNICFCGQIREIFSRLIYSYAIFTLNASANSENQETHAAE